MKAKASIIALAAFLPAVAVAATNQTLATFIDLIVAYLNKALVLLMALSVVFFVWYVIKYFIGPSASENRTEAGKYVMYSLIGFFVILSFWGLVNILQNTFGLGNQYNRSSSWYEFMNIFPGGSGGSGGNRIQNPAAGSGFNPPAPTSYDEAIRQGNR